jgi:hypothetical protein
MQKYSCPESQAQYFYFTFFEILAYVFFCSMQKYSCPEFQPQYFYFTFFEISAYVFFCVKHLSNICITFVYSIFSISTNNKNTLVIK